MAQIAERSGVALSTVSYVLSGKRPVSPAMRDRVLAAVAEFDYRPHGLARALASGNSRTIALFLPSPHWGRDTSGQADGRTREGRAAFGSDPDADAECLVVRVS